MSNLSVISQVVVTTCQEPLCLQEYIAVRDQLVELEAQRRELEAEVIKWAVLTIRNKDVSSKILPVPTLAARGQELILKEVTQYDKANPELIAIDKEIEAQQQKALGKNAANIARLTVEQAAITEQLNSISNTSHGKNLMNKRDVLIFRLQTITPKKQQLQLRNKAMHKILINEEYS